MREIQLLGHPVGQPLSASVVVKPITALATNALAKAPRSCGGRPTPHQVEGLAYGVA